MSVCLHLRPLEEELIARGVREIFRGRAWTEHCREWVYFACVLDLPALRQRFAFPALVEDRYHVGAHDGQECGFVCTVHADGIMGDHPEHARVRLVVR